MPRLYHRKSANGCLRCKQRRVKCDEKHPQCGACQRHRAACHYQKQSSRYTKNLETEPPEDAAAVLPGRQHPGDLQIDTSFHARDPQLPTIELALLHYFYTETVVAFHDPIAVWKTRIPLVGFRNRFVLDALLSLAALDLYRHTNETYNPHSIAQVGLDGGQDFHVDWSAVTKGRVHYLIGHTPGEMRHLSRVYFDSAIEGQRSVLEDPHQTNFEAAFMTSLAIMMHSLWSLGCSPLEVPDHGHDLVAHDEGLWFRLGLGCLEIVRRWNQSASINVLQSAGYYKMKPDYSDEEELFHWKYRDLFQSLLAWAAEFEKTTLDENEAYAKAVSYLGLLYTGIRDNSEPAAVSGSLIASFPGKVPRPFLQLVLEERPRALVIVGYLFAMMRLLEAELPYHKGIAVRQIAGICNHLPQG